MKIIQLEHRAGGSNVDEMLGNPLSHQNSSKNGSRSADHTWKTARAMMDGGATAGCLANGLQFTSRIPTYPESILLSLGEAAFRLRNVQILADSTHDAPLVFSCTHAKEAGLLAEDSDPRDRRYLSGMRVSTDLHVYCGSIDAAVKRAQAFAEYSDVVCYRTSKVDLFEAECFAAEIRAASPCKKLGFGYEVNLSTHQGSDLDNVDLEKSVRRIGYEYFFWVHSQSIVFPSSPTSKPWIFFDDATTQSCIYNLAADVPSFHNSTETIRCETSLHKSQRKRMSGR
jgi:isocitrate lyase